MMISFFKHISFRIWCTVLLGGLLSLWLLPLVQPQADIEWYLLPVAVILVVVYVVTGWLFNRRGMNTIERLMHEAAAFERDGMYPEAEDAFKEAMAVLDSFLISPLVRRGKSGLLGARMARFYLARTHRNADTEEFIVLYLQSTPRDEEVAETWLQQVESRGGLKEEHQELASQIGSAFPENSTIQRILARFFLLMERTDFPALQTYRRVFQDDDPLSADFVENLARLFLREKRADEWALDVYLRALSNNVEPETYLRALAACIRWIPGTQRNRPLRQAAYKYLTGFGKSELRSMSAGFNPSLPSIPSEKSRRKIRAQLNYRNEFAKMGRALYEYPVSVIRRNAARMQTYLGHIRHTRKARTIFTAALLVALVLVVGGLVVNTVGHLHVAETPVAKKAETAMESAADPYTLQVAAYLSLKYAKQYVDHLKQQGLDAYWTEAVRGTKRWYQVRVSHFPDKQSARRYGESLKTKGVIEDYYVASYSKP
jgi:hypothetical protein